MTFIAVDLQGLVNQDTFEEIIRTKKPALVSVMLANNETGVIQEIGRLAESLNEHNILFHSDAVQAAGKIPVSFVALGVKLISLSSHKMYGPKGAGALVFEKGFKISPLLLGGGQEQGYRAGTENIAAIVGFGKAADDGVDLRPGQFGAAEFGRFRVREQAAVAQQLAFGPGGTAGAVSLGGGGFEPACGALDRVGVVAEVAVEQVRGLAAFELACGVRSIHCGRLTETVSRSGITPDFW